MEGGTNERSLGHSSDWNNNGLLYISVSDFDQTGIEISKTRKEMKPKVDNLRDLEHKDELKGFNLQPLSSTEVASLENVLWWRNRNLD